MHAAIEITLSLRVVVKCQSISLMTITTMSTSLINYDTLIILIIACVILEHTLFCQVSKTVRADLFTE